MYVYKCRIIGCTTKQEIQTTHKTQVTLQIVCRNATRGENGNSYHVLHTFNDIFKLLDTGWPRNT